MKKAWQFYYEEYLATTTTTTNNADKELDARLEKITKLVAEIESDIEEIKNLIADSEAAVSEEAFEAGFKFGSASNS